MSISNTLLYPMKVNCARLWCFANTLLLERGFIDDVDITPHFFVNSTKLDDVIAWITAPKMRNVRKIDVRY